MVPCNIALCNVVTVNVVPCNIALCNVVTVNVVPCNMQVQNPKTIEHQNMQSDVAVLINVDL